jgi:hypothetical protein
MSCCGGRRSNVVAMPAVTRPQRPSAPIPGSQTTVAIVQYVGHSSLTVYGPSTGRKYWFRGYGAELAVDLSDRASLRDVPNLREVRMATV